VFAFPGPTAKSAVRAIPRAKLKTIRIAPKGVRSDRWIGIQHEALASCINREAKEAGMKIISESWAVSEDQHDLFGDLTVQPSSRIKDWPSGLLPSMGVLHSNMGRTALRLYAGATVTVCSNGLVAVAGSDIVLARKHTSGINLNLAVAHGLEKFEKRLNEIPKFVRILKESNLAESEAALTVNEIGALRWMPWSDIGKVWSEWRTPRHKDFQPRTRWSLYNAFTEVMKRRPVQSQVQLFRNLAPKLLPQGTFVRG